MHLCSGLRADTAGAGRCVWLDIFILPNCLLLTIAARPRLSTNSLSSSQVLWARSHPMRGSGVPALPPIHPSSLLHVEAPPAADSCRLMPPTATNASSAAAHSPPTPWFLPHRCLTHPLRPPALGSCLSAPGGLLQPWQHDDDERSPPTTPTGRRRAVTATGLDERVASSSAAARRAAAAASTGPHTGGRGEDDGDVAFAFCMDWATADNVRLVAPVAGRRRPPARGAAFSPSARQPLGCDGLPRSAALAAGAPRDGAARGGNRLHSQQRRTSRKRQR